MHVSNMMDSGKKLVESNFFLLEAALAILDLSALIPSIFGPSWG